jgi:hypothetical protein
LACVLLKVLMYRKDSATWMNIIKWNTLIQSNTTQVYFDSNCAFTCVLHVSACT